MEDQIERTLVLLKPDAVKRGLMGEVISRFEKSGMKIAAMKLKWANPDSAGQHYGEDIITRRGEKVRQLLIDFITTGPILAIVIEGVNAVENVRMMVGSTEPKSALPGTIRGDYSHISYARADAAGKAVANIIHASATPEEADKEIHIWFSEEEIYSYKTVYEDLTF
ncbi:MAG: Nucleoside diphosphate kinase [Parcubacteria group bacterium ADurb.Bin326]|nr:MAG: Nucleoside diphosphate kinase [Parcubacteria group bacterium ADurb.Bin326]